MIILISAAESSPPPPPHNVCLSQADSVTQQKKTQQRPVSVNFSYVPVIHARGGRFSLLLNRSTDQSTLKYLQYFPLFCFLFCFVLSPPPPRQLSSNLLASLNASPPQLWTVCRSGDCSSRAGFSFVTFRNEVSRRFTETDPS